MAEFSEEEARRLVGLHGLSEETITTWRFRKAIPDRFYKPGYVHRHKVKEVAPVQGLKLDRLATVLNNEKLYRERLGALADLDKSLTLEFMKGRGVSLNEEERLRLTKVIQQLRNDIKNAVGAQTETLSTLRMKAIFKIATDDRLKKVPLFGDVLGRKLSKSGQKREGITFDRLSRDEYGAILDALYILLLETTL